MINRPPMQPQGRTPSRPRWFRELRFLAINVVVAALLCVGVVAVIDSRIVTAADLGLDQPTDSPTATAPSLAPVPPTPTPTPSDGYRRLTLEHVPATARFLQVSFDNLYYNYLDAGVVHIFTVSNGKQVHQITAPHPIAYSLLLDDADLIVYFYQSGTSITAKTYNIATHKSLSYLPFHVSPGAKIIKVNYAVNTNLVYVITRSPQDGDTVNRIDIMNKVTTRRPNAPIANFIPSATSLGLYYQSTTYRLYYNYTPVKAMAGRKVELIGRGANDQFYVRSRTTPNQVDVLSRQKGTIVRTFLIPAGALNFYCDQSTIYAIYADRLVDLTSKALHTVEFQNPGRFVAAVGKSLYFLPVA